MEYLKSNDNKELVKDVITQDISGFQVDSVNLVEDGWDNLVAEINGDYIFRFPKDPGESEYPGIKKQFEREIKLLKFLEGKIKTWIPKIEFIGTRVSYLGYRKIPGSPLTKKLLETWDASQKEKLIFDLANFLSELHETVSIEMAEGLGFEKEDLRPYRDFILKKLVPKIRDSEIMDFIKVTLAEYDQMMTESTESVFLHNDLHAQNMAINESEKRLNGIFDFGDAMIGDVNIDFYPLYQFDPYFMKMVVENYQKLTGRKLNLRRMVIYGRVNALCDLAEFIDYPEKEVYKYVMKKIGDWRKEIDIFKQQQQ